MPNRILRDCTDSEKINLIEPLSERFFYRLIMVVDDYGRYYAHPGLLKARAFPFLLDKVREADISRWMAECQKAGLIALYEVKGKNYLEILDFRQRLDKAKEKFPAPPKRVDNDFLEVVTEFPAETRKEAEADLETESEKETETDGARARPVIDSSDKSLKKSSPLFHPYESKVWFDEWDRWVKYRKDIKKPYRSIDSQQEQLKWFSDQKFSLDQALEIIRYSIRNNYQGLFEPKVNAQTSTSAGQLVFPNHYDQKFESKLNGKDLTDYWAHLRSLGWKAVKKKIGGVEKVTTWTKMSAA